MFGAPASQYDIYRRVAGWSQMGKRDVPPDNNASERSLRPVKTKLKVSGQFKSTEGAHQYATLQSIVQTARKCGQDPLVALLTLAEL